METTLDPMTAPLGEVLDWLAERDGWRKPRPGDKDFTLTGDAMGMWYHRPSGACVGIHPITLDRLAGMLPEGWTWGLIQQCRSHGRLLCSPKEWHAVAVAVMLPTIEAWANTELEARARVVAAVLMRDKQSP